MPHTLAEIPLEFRPKKLAASMVFGLVILLEVVFAVNFELQAKWPLATFFTHGLPTTLAFAFMVGVCVWGIVDVQRKTDRIHIDETGLTVCLHGVERRYAWTDMARFHKVLVHKRSQMHMVAIERWSDMNFDAKANVIWPRFGPGTDELLKLLVAGKARWGGGQTA